MVVMAAGYCTLLKEMVHNNDNGDDNDDTVKGVQVKVAH